MEMMLHGPYYAFNPVGCLVSAEESYQRERAALREQGTEPEPAQPTRW